MKLRRALSWSQRSVTESRIKPNTRERYGIQACGSLWGWDQPVLPSDAGFVAAAVRSLPGVTASSVDFVLDARNNMSVVSSTAAVTGSDTDTMSPSITQLNVNPTRYTEARATATLQWATDRADRVSLLFNDVAVPNFPESTTTGSFQILIEGDATFTLRATNTTSTSVERSVTVVADFADREPNNNSSQAITVTPSDLPIRGTVSASGDVDWYRFEVLEDNSYLYAQAGWFSGTCAFDSVIQLYDNRVSLLGRSETALQPNVGPCAEIHPLGNTFARDLPAGTYYLVVTGRSGASGTYRLFIDARGPTAVPSGATITRRWFPFWEIADLQVFSLPVGPSATLLQQNIDQLVGPFHALDGFFQGSTLPLLTHLEPHIFPYASEMRAYTMAAGYEPKTTFSVEELSDGNAVVLAYTIVATSSSAWGGSPDFVDLGRIIDNRSFPIFVDFSVVRNGFAWQGPEPFVQFPSYDAWPPGGSVGGPSNPRDGSSHRHFLHLASSTFAGNPTSPGTYEFQVTLVDTSSSGYDLLVPFTVQ